MSDDPVVGRLDGIDGPVSLPDDLRQELTSLLAGGDPVAVLGDAVEQGGPSVSLPADLRDRLEATVLGGRAPLPVGVRRRIRRALVPAESPGVLRIAAVAVAVLLVAGGLAFATTRGDGDRRPSVDLATEPGDDARRSTTRGDDVGGLEGTGIDPAAVVAGAEATTTTAATAPTTARRPGGDGSAPPPAGDGRLVAYSSCDDLLGRTKAAALAVVGPWGLDRGPGIGGGPPQEMAAGPSSSDEQAAVTTAGGEDTAEASGTNVQEEGVDEPDIVKSDGRRIVTLVDNELRVSRNEGGRLVGAGSMRLPDGASGHELLVHGDRAVVLGWWHEPQPQPQPEPQPRPAGDSASMTTTWIESRAAVWTVDLRNPATMAIEATLLLDGTIGAARLADGRVRLAVTSRSVGPAFVHPTDGTREAEQRALEENRRRVERSTLDDWSPTYALLRGTDASTARTGRLCACDDTLRPEEGFAGSSTISVLTLDPERPDQPPTGSAAVQGWAETVYASRANLFVTTRSFAARVDASTPTALHRFDISAADRATYRGSGEVRGATLSAFSLSERNGHLRVATTDAVDDVESAGSTESFVTVLAVRDDRLEPVGQVGGLGKGERIFAVRFLDDVGYVVTFRQTDPLYTIDLRDPTRPVLRGELKIPGFSSYLHPFADGRLLGVGQDAASDTGRATGAQVSSFDVRDVARPTEVARIGFGDRTTSEVQHDHHAFLWWAPARRAMVPVQRYDDRGGATGWLSVVDVPEDGRITEAGRISHAGREHVSSAMIRRSFVVGDVLYTLSHSGILASDLGTLADRSWLPFR